MITKKRQITIGDKVVFGHFSFMPPLIASADLKNEACFIFPLHTKGNIYRPDGTKQVSEEQAVLMKCGQYINKWQSVDQNKDTEVVIIWLYPEIVNPILESRMQVSKTKEETNDTRISTEVVQLDTLFQKYLESLLFYFENPSMVNDELVILKIKELMLLLLNSEQHTPIHELIFSLFEPVKYSLQEIVDIHLFEDLSLDELSSLAGMSTSTFKRKFKQLIGDSPGHYINSKRLQIAAKQLKNTRKNISEIAYDCGYNDPNYFTKLFSKEFGCSPSKYRKI